MVDFRKMAVVLATVVAGVAMSAPHPASAAKAKPKPAAKKPAPPAKQPPVLGTQQLKGDQAQLGVTYTLGKEDPINIAVSAMRYSVERISIGEHRYVPKADEKLLVIDFLFHNPQKQERLVRFDTVSFTAIDSKNANQEGARLVGVPGSNEDLSISLKPGQKKTAFTYVVVPAALSVPKLVIKSPDDLVLRYDLRGKIKPLAAPFADPKVPGGVGALETVPVALNTTCQLGLADEFTWDILVESVAFVEGTLGEHELEEGTRLLVVTAKATNQSADTNLLRSDTLWLTAVTADGERFDAVQEMLHPTSNRSIEYNLQKGGTGRFRRFFQVPKDAKIKALQVRQGEGARIYETDISGVQ